MATTPTNEGESRSTQLQEKFIFDSEHLLSFCEIFTKTDAKDHTDSIFETK